MDKVKLTLSEVNEKTSALGGLITDANDKLNYAAKKIFQRIEATTKSYQKEYNETLEDLRIKHASSYPADYEDKAKVGHLITNEKGGYSYTKEATTAFNQEVRPVNKAFEQQVIEVEPYKVGSGNGWERVKDIDPFIKEQLSDLLFIGYNAEDDIDNYQEESGSIKSTPKIMEVIKDEPKVLDAETIEEIQTQE